MPRQIAPKLRERLREARERVTERRFLGQASNPARTEQGQVQVGGGALLSRGRNVSQKAIDKIEELRPGVLPKVTERIERVKPLRTAGEEALETEGQGPAGAGESTETTSSSSNPAGVGQG